MNTKTHQQQQARNLFFQSDLSQQQIADLLKVSRKTIGLWIQQGSWDEMKRTARQSPGMVLHDLYDQLFALNTVIAARADHPFPSVEESIIQRRLMVSIKSIEQQPTSNYIQVFTELQHFLLFQSPELAKQLTPHVDRFVKEKTASTRRHTNQEMFLYDTDPELDDDDIAEDEDAEPADVTFGEISENVISEENSTVQPDPPVQTSHNNFPADVTFAPTEPVLPSGISWLGRGMVYDPALGRERRVKKGECDQLLALGLTACELDDW